MVWNIPLVNLGQLAWLCPQGLVWAGLWWLADPLVLTSQVASAKFASQCVHAPLPNALHSLQHLSVFPEVCEWEGMWFIHSVFLCPRVYEACLTQFSLGHCVATKCVSHDLRSCSEQWHGLLDTFPASQLLPLPWWACSSCLGILVAMAQCNQFARLHLTGNPEPLPSIPGIFHSCGSLDGSTCFTLVDNLCDGLSSQVYSSGTSPSVCCIPS